MHKGEDDLPYCLHWECNLKLSWGFFKLDFWGRLFWVASHAELPLIQQGLVHAGRWCGGSPFVVSFQEVRNRCKLLLLVRYAYACLCVEVAHFKACAFRLHKRQNTVKISSLKTSEELSFSPEEPLLWPWLLTGVEGGEIDQIKCKTRRLNG